MAAWLYLVFFGSLIAFNAYMILLARAPASLASSYTFVNPVIAMLLGVAVGGEVVSTFEWGCGGNGTSRRGVDAAAGMKASA